tara:strand:- start:2611 stop:2736 length:126 start_codon:yes stop_codon:yes gene_type:complete
LSESEENEREPTYASIDENVQREGENPQSDVRHIEGVEVEK